MEIPPPSVPTALGSRLYEWEDLQFDDNIPVPSQMRAKSLRRLQIEEQRYLFNKDEDYRQFRRQNEETPRYCKICSESLSYVHDTLTVVTHSHVSSLKRRIDANTDRWGQYECDSCSTRYHTALCGTRYPILATSSTMNQWQGNLDEDRSRGNKFHIENIGIPGGKVEDIHHAFMAEYNNSEIPVDILLIAGFNNLLDGQTPAIVMDEIEHFREDVIRIHDSTFAVSTLPLAPIISWLPQDNYVNRHRNMTDDLIELNNSIKELNSLPGHHVSAEWCPQFHTWGLKSSRVPRTIGPRGLLEALPAHQPNDWREQQPRNQLHLTDKVRRRMGKAVENYFAYIYKMKKH